MGARGLVDAGAGLLGMENMEVQEARKREQALSGLDMSSPESIMQRAQQITDPQLKMKLQMLAQQKMAERQKMQMEQMKFQNEMNPFAKINPKDYTQESLLAFMKSRNPADLKAIESSKAGTEDVSLGGGLWQAYETVNGRPDLTKPIGKPFAKRATASESNVTVNGEKQATEFEKALGKGQATSVLDSRQTAEDAASIMETVQIGKSLLDKGMITGFGADALRSFGSALNSVGITLASDPVANTEAYGAAMAQNVAKIIKQFGAGTGLSDADREYAQKMAGGQVTLTEKSLRKILEINEKMAVNVVNRHNQKVSGIKTNIPLEVSLPQVKQNPVNQIPGSIGAPPPGAVRRKGG
jgi:hypothetical protein